MPEQLPDRVKVFAFHHQLRRRGVGPISSAT